jgi:hypothetical protein
VVDRGLGSRERKGQPAIELGSTIQREEGIILVQVRGNPETP